MDRDGFIQAFTEAIRTFQGDLEGLIQLYESAPNVRVQSAMSSFVAAIYHELSGMEQEVKIAIQQPVKKQKQG